MKIDVTQEDIDKGYRFKSTSCPVARAIKRATSRSVVSVGAGIIIDGSYIRSPNSVDNFIECFDLGMLTVPFSFELDYEG